jgi:L-iditol 2-dehydrogenase
MCSPFLSLSFYVYSNYRIKIYHYRKLMKALVLESYNHLVYKDVLVPEPALDEILLKIKSCGICGSDVHGLDGSSGRRIPPLIMGHEASGIIEAKGENVSYWNIGDRVTFDSTIYPENDWFSKRGQYNLSEDRKVLGVSCEEYRRDGAFAEYVVIPQHILHRLPDNVSFNQAAMVEPASVALHAINLSNISPEDSVMVIGAGIIGLFAIKLLKTQGCKNIISVDI